MPRNHGGLFFSRGETPADPSPLFFSGGCNGRGEWQLSRGTSGFTALVSFAGAAWCRIRLTSMHLTSAGTGKGAPNEHRLFCTYWFGILGKIAVQRIDGSVGSR